MKHVVGWAGVSDGPIDLWPTDGQFAIFRTYRIAMHYSTAVKKVEIHFQEGRMNKSTQTNLLEAALKRIIEEAKRNPYGSVYDLRQIAREALEKIGIKD